MEMFWEIVKDLLWPLKGIILFEEQALEWGLAWLIANSTNIIGTIIVIFGIGMLLSYSNIEGYMRRSRFRLLAFLVLAIAIPINILIAWVSLILGAARGRITASEPVTSYTLETHDGRMRTRRERNRANLHYRLGRWIYSTFYNRVFFFIENVNVRAAFSRGIALLIILWGVWHIPYTLLN